MNWTENSFKTILRGPAWVCHLLCWVLVMLPGLARATESQDAPPVTQSIAPIDRDTARLLRSWMTEQPVLDDSLRQDPAYRVDRINADWVTYCKSLRIEDPNLREKALRRLYKQTESESLRGMSLLAIREDPAFQSRQAQFVRRYGFYANWFNRVVHTAGRTLQGNVSSVFGLGVDAVFDVFRPASASDLERRALDKELQSRAANATNTLDSDTFKELERRVMRGRAESDLAQAEWALDNEAGDAAVFYARQALWAEPDWKKAQAVLREAEEAEAARLRRGIASRQAGYPDRQPPIELAPPDMLLALLLMKPSGGDALLTGDPLLRDLVYAMPEAGQGRVGRMKDWNQALARHPKAPLAERLWADAMALSPLINPDQRLAQAQWRRRGQISRYIFWGPETGRQHARRYAQGTAQMFDALQNLGFFYIFEIAGRAVNAAVASPAPEEAVLDARAAWLSECDDLQSPQARQVAEDLAKVYLAAGRFEDARARLRASGLWDEDRAAKLDRTQARALMAAGLAMPEGPERTAVFEKVQSLAPDTRLAAKARKILARNDSGDEVGIHVDWDVYLTWAGRPAPAGMPGDASWFDGRLDNGEVSSKGLTIEKTEPTGETYQVHYMVMYPGGKRVCNGDIQKSALDAEVVEWIERAFSQQVQNRETIDNLDRFPLAFELEGSAGLTHVDLSPKILPLSDNDEQARLYH